VKLDNVRLLVSRFDECFRFYRDAMGLEVTWGEEGEHYASFRAEGGGLAIFDRKAMADAVGAGHLPSHAIGQDRVALVFEVRNVDAAIARLRAAGVPLVTEPKDRPDWGIRTAHLRDPDGTLIELEAPLGAAANPR